MAPRGGSRKPKKAMGSSGEDKTSPTELEWSRMKRYGSFVVPDADSNNYTFIRGQTATVLPNHFLPGTDVPQYDYWVVKIKDIRAYEHEDGTNEVWVRVQWFYSAKDVASVVKSFNTRPCGRYERMFSDHFDYVTPEAFNEIVTVSQVRDDDPEQPFVDKASFYTRYEIERQTRRLKPKPGENSCVCNKPYNPDDESQSSVMHFCPRPKCRKWYHQTCLVKQNSKAPCLPHVRSLRLISTSPDDDCDMQLYERIPQPPMKRTRNSLAGERERSDESDPTLRIVLGELPDALVAVAEQPIVRGALYERGGVCGNVKAVVQARRLVYEGLAGTPLPDDWEDMVLGPIAPSTLEDALVKIKGKRSIPPLICPGCKSAI